MLRYQVYCQYFIVCNTHYSNIVTTIATVQNLQLCNNNRQLDLNPLQSILFVDQHWGFKNIAVYFQNTYPLNKRRLWSSLHYNKPSRFRLWCLVVHLQLICACVGPLKIGVHHFTCLIVSPFPISRLSPTHFLFNFSWELIKLSEDTRQTKSFGVE